MGILDFFKQKQEYERYAANRNNAKKTAANYNNFIEIAQILSNSDDQIAADFNLLVKNYPAFYKKYETWCKKIIGDLDDRYTQLLLLSAYWLVGYEHESGYGVYIDWREEANSVVSKLTQVIEKNGYELSLSGLDFNGEEYTDEVLQKINDRFQEKGYVLITFDTQSDCYHLFITTIENYTKLKELGKDVDVNFYNNYV